MAGPILGRCGTCQGSLLAEPYSLREAVCVLNNKDVPGHLVKVDGELLEDFSRYAGRGKITVLGVMVSGGPYAEDREWRIRNRYAVLAGLDKDDYKPVDPEHLNFTGIEEKEHLVGGK